MTARPASARRTAGGGTGEPPNRTLHLLGGHRRRLLHPVGRLTVTAAALVVCLFFLAAALIALNDRGRL